MARAATIVVLSSLLPLLACSGGGGSGGSGGSGQAGAAAAGSGGAGTAGAAGNGAAGSGVAGSGVAGGGGGSSAQALCTSSCAAFVACGVTTKSTCATDCQNASATYRSCIGTAGSDCNALALCYFQAVAGTNCTTGGGVPGGTDTCSATEACQASCNTNGAGPACRCACAGSAAPAVANLLLGVNSCATDLCASGCTGAGSADCNTCFDTNCQTPRTACLAN